MLGGKVGTTGTTYIGSGAELTGIDIIFIAHVGSVTLFVTNRRTIAALSFGGLSSISTGVAPLKSATIVLSAVLIKIQNRL